MMYNFIENKNAYDDPNVNLNFDDDITYQYLNGDYDVESTHNIVPTVDPSVPPTPAGEKRQDVDYKKDRSDSTSAIYTMFILMAILIIVIWYIYRSTRPSKEIVEISTIESPLIMASPHFDRY